MGVIVAFNDFFVIKEETRSLFSLYPSHHLFSSQTSLDPPCLNIFDPPGIRRGGQMSTTQKNIKCVPSPTLSIALDFMSIS